jgi:hypothetical protein
MGAAMGRQRGATGAAISRVQSPLPGVEIDTPNWEGADVCPSLIERIPEHDDHHLSRPRSLYWLSIGITEVKEH